MSNHARALTVLLVTVVFALGAACAGSEDADGRYSSMLRLVPDQPAFREGVTIVDYEAIRALPGYEASRPLGQTDVEAAADPEALFKALGWHGVSGVPIELLGLEYQFMEGRPVLQEGFGIGLDNVDRSLIAGIVPPRTLHIAAGDFDPGAINDALAACEDCEPGEPLEYAGLAYTSWGIEARADHRNRPPAFDQLGRGGLFRFTDDYIIRSNFLDEFEASLDASLGENSLLDDESFRLLGDALDEHELVAVHVGDRPQDREFARQVVESMRDNAGGVEFAAAWDLPNDVVLPARYEAFAIGAGVEDDEPYTLVLFVYPTESEATKSVDRFRERLSTGLSDPGRSFSDVFTSTDVTTDGRLLVATLRGQARFVIQFGIEPLLLHE